MKNNKGPKNYDFEASYFTNESQYLLLNSRLYALIQLRRVV